MVQASKQMDLKGKIAVITGGNSGIGLAIATALAQAGYNLVISGRRQSKNQAVTDALARKFKVQTLAVEADVSREADCVRLIQDAVAKFGTLHIMVNSAGIGGGGLVAETKTEDFDRVLKTNLYGTFWCARAAYPHMKRNQGDPRGVIINISSLAGKQSWSGTGTYSASKFAINGLTQALADEGKTDHIKAIAICPAMVATPMTGVSGPEYLQAEDIAETVLYLLRLSPAAWPTEVVLERRDA
jgi:NAD(P)-dependent dehydrogenase (short-subunit alcohol dehydrogenase family)